jgi:hypothetical protein
MLTPDVHLTVTTTQPFPKPSDTTGVEAYMEGLIAFALAVEPGSARVTASLGDERNSLIMLTVKATLGPDGPSVTVPAARLALLDEHDKIKAEQVIFFVVPA